MTPGLSTSPDVSVIVPLKNEAPSLQTLHALVVKVLERMGRSFEILFVDDGSTDTSPQILAGLIRADGRVRVLRLRRNFGKAAALSAGFGEARGRAVITMDADLQDDPEEFPNLLAGLADGYDLVSGWKTKRKDRFLRRIASRMFNWATRRMSGLPLHDFDCGLKAYSSACAMELATASYGELHRFLPVLAHARGFAVTEIPVRHHPRRSGSSKYGPSRYPRALLDLFTSTFLARYARRPLHALGGLGLLLMGPGMLMVTGTVAARIAFGTTAGGWILVLGGLMCLTGLQLMAIGLVAELVTAHRGSDVAYTHVVAFSEAGAGPARSESESEIDSELAQIGGVR
jgi:glycosyltransferase involved in cell wall biosynthesis